MKAVEFMRAKIMSKVLITMSSVLKEQMSKKPVLPGTAVCPA